MLAIWKKEFVQSFKSVFSIVTIAIFTAVSYYLSDFIAKNGAMLGKEVAEEGYVSGLVLLIYLFGFLFMFSLFHDTMNRELESRTIRFLVTKTSRLSIVLGKFLGIFTYWFVCLLVSFGIITVFAEKFYFKSFGQLLVMILYMVSMCLLLSSLIPRRSMSMFSGLLVGLAIPLFGLWSQFSDKLWLKIFKYATPYYYFIDGGSWGWAVVLLMAAVMLGGSILLLQRRDL
ncbi:ABC transporter permease [Paenibacillus oleatilyticus]|uniref:ABC transporter permease n=1 Tax=Paenibacillus oleatilyticus TaxID=2594886 RepID=A0ABV4V0I8_9BACL